jgi:hypothetical protein
MTMHKRAHWSLLCFPAMIAFFIIGCYCVSHSAIYQADAWLMLALEMFGLQAAWAIVVGKDAPTPGDLVGASCFAFGVLITLFACLARLSENQITVALLSGGAFIMICIKAAEFADWLWKRVDCTRTCNCRVTER